MKKRVSHTKTDRVKFNEEHEEFLIESLAKNGNTQKAFDLFVAMRERQYGEIISRETIEAAYEELLGNGTNGYYTAIDVLDRGILIDLKDLMVKELNELTKIQVSGNGSDTVRLGKLLEKMGPVFNKALQNLNLCKSNLLEIAAAAQQLGLETIAASAMEKSEEIDRKCKCH